MKATSLAVLALFLFGFYTDVSSEQSSATNGSAGYKSESSYGWQDGRGI